MRMMGAKIRRFGPGNSISLGEGGAALFRTPSQHEIFLRSTVHPERVCATNERTAEEPNECLNARIHPVSAIPGNQILKRIPYPNQLHGFSGKQSRSNSPSERRP